MTAPISALVENLLYLFIIKPDIFRLNDKSKLSNLLKGTWSFSSGTKSCPLKLDTN